MTRAQLQALVEVALSLLCLHDSYLFEQNMSERCLMARLAHYLQLLLPDWSVDVEFNREGGAREPKQLGLDEACANRRDAQGNAYVVPDLIVHRRGPTGPNLFVAELKKTTNRISRDCDQARVPSFCDQLGYAFGAVIELETRAGFAPATRIERWYGN